MSAPLRELVVIEDGTIAGMAAEARFLTAFPFLKTLSAVLTTSTSCSSCGGGSTNGRSDALKAARRSLAGLSSDRKIALKQMLNAKRVRLVYRDDNSDKGIKLTF